jgi:hypothetical protein
MELVNAKGVAQGREEVGCWACADTLITSRKSDLTEAIKA